MSRLHLSEVLFNRLRLKPLVIFDKVLKTQSIAHAARELNLTQSTVTKAIQELERQLDIKLFERTNRGVQPTTSALLLGERLTTVLAELRYLTDEILIFNGGEIGHVIVGTLISASAQLLPKAILLLKEKSPNVKVTVQMGTTEQLFPALASGELDMVVGRIPEARSTFNRQYPLNHKAFYQERLNIIARMNHPLALKSDCTYRDLSDYPWILPPKGAILREATRDFFYERGIPEPTNVVESLSLMTNIHIMSQSDFICFMPSIALRHLIQSELLAPLPFSDVGPLTGVGVSTYQGRKLSPAGYLLIDCLKLATVELLKSDLEAFSETKPVG